MENLRRIAQGLNVQPLLDKIATKPSLWDEITIRQDYEGSAHHDTKCIILRGSKTFSQHDVQEDLGSYDYPYIEELMPQVQQLLKPALLEMGIEELGRVMVVELAAGGSIDEHIDEGAYAQHFERFHVVLSSQQGNIFTCGGEQVHMQPGELWWFNHHKPHSVVNHSNAGRIHIIIDAVRVPQSSKATFEPLHGIHEISYEAGLKDVGELLKQHWHEVAKNKGIMILKPDTPRYLAMEKANMLLILAAYEHGQMVGYSLNIVGNHLHYADLVYAHNDLLFLHKDYRNTPIGLKLIRQTEKAAKERGARLMLWHAKEGTSLDKIMPRLKYNVQDIMYSKEL